MSHDKLLSNPRLFAVLASLEGQMETVITDCALKGDEDVLLLAAGLVSVGTSMFHSDIPRARFFELVTRLWDALDRNHASERTRKATSS
jgi:hypothetical protein